MPSNNGAPPPPEILQTPLIPDNMQLPASLNAAIDDADRVAFATRDAQSSGFGGLRRTTPKKQSSTTCKFAGGCSSRAIKHHLCFKHGAATTRTCRCGRTEKTRYSGPNLGYRCRSCTYKCAEPFCTKGATGSANRYCTNHGGRDICAQDGCSNARHIGGLCTKHRTTPAQRCSRAGCNNFPKRGGVCIAHGAVTPRCSSPGCTNKARRKHLCVRHGAKNAACSREGCTRRAQLGGVCCSHGSVAKRCSRGGCTKRAMKAGVCTRHGDHPRCSHEGCTNVIVSRGVCHVHGAYRTRCAVPGCENYRQRGGVCVRHKDVRVERRFSKPKTPQTV